MTSAGPPGGGAPTALSPAVPARMDRDGAVGWRDVPLDGLTCYHRCIEAILRGRGFTAAEVIEELGGAVTDRLGTDGSPHVRLRASTARWLMAPPGGDRWDDVQALLRSGQGVVIWPDGFFWPGDSCEGRRHIHHHAVLATGIDEDGLRFLDIDAAEADGFARVVPVTAQVRRACTRLLELPSVTRGPQLQAADARRLIAASIRPLARFADGAAQLADRWVTPSRRLVHAADLWVLGDIQPQLYLLACICQRFGYEDLAARGFETATQAKKISLFLAGLHQYKPRAPYDLCRDDIAVLAARLRAVSAAAVAACGPPAPEPAAPADSWLWRRLDTLARWHFGSGLDPQSEG